MKILRLNLKNFAHIFSGLGKYEIDLDFRSTHKTINVIIGKMGSCKTVILGHLQPFSSFGSLDVRNQDEIILPEKDGRKILEVQDGDNYYTIKHIYLWKKDHHMVKSFIAKNGNELNPSGGVNSFKALVEVELGITPSFLVLTRLGSNVTNLIDMKAADRKSFMASMLSGAEIYSMLYKKLNEEMRTLNAQMALIVRKITSLSNGNVEDLKNQYHQTMDEIEDLTKDKEAIQTSISEVEATIKVILNGRSIEAYQAEMNLHKDESEKMKALITEKENTLKELKTSQKSVSDVAKEIGSIESQLKTNEEMKLSLNDSWQKIQENLNKLIEQRMLNSNRDQVDSLRKSYMEVVDQIDSMRQELRDFKCPYNSGMISELMEQINTINILINELSDYDNDSVIQILQKGPDSLKYASRQIEHLNLQKLKLQAKINNFKFLGSYTPDETLYVPPLCPTEDCPFYKTHPAIMQSKYDQFKVEKEFQDIQIQINAIDVNIGRFSEYTLIYNKLSILKSLWSPAVNKLSELGVVRTTALTRVLSTLGDQVWYDHNKLMDILEKCKHRELYYTLTEKSSALKAELTNLSRYDSKELEEIIENQQNQSKSILDTLHKLEDDNKKLKEQKESLDKLYLELSSIVEIEKEVEGMKNELVQIVGVYNSMNESLQTIYDKSYNLSDLKASLEVTNGRLQNLNAKFQKIQMTLNDISYAQKDYDALVDKQEALKYIVEAVSSNKGIPLVYIKLFLRDCKDTLNDLISDVFGDSIEVLNFIINENEFKIPYAINGSPVEDIAKASQGQKAIISLALSFALMRQAHSRWNIMLLDEMDGPLYKTDRSKFITILYKQLVAIDADQVFLISHNFTFEGNDVNVIMTTDEHVDKSSMLSVMHV
nr:MAG TPA: STRUCTURAL MAINTENANCE OF CHROMOSOMES PROTEIN [Caudoviricetes sp.]